MEWILVDSSAVSSAAYDEPKQHLYLRFHSGEIYRYFDFPSYRWNEFLAVESKGRFFAEHIRDNFRYEHI
jgi:hypothetical protein